MKRDVQFGLEFVDWFVDGCATCHKFTLLIVRFVRTLRFVSLMLETFHGEGGRGW